MWVFWVNSIKEMSVIYDCLRAVEEEEEDEANESEEDEEAKSYQGQSLTDK